jgi:hypothetical protein
MKTKNKVLAAAPVAVVFMLVFTFAGCDSGGGGRSGEYEPLEVFPMGYSFIAQGRLWSAAGLIDGTNNYLVEDNGLLAMGLEQSGAYSTWVLYAEEVNQQFTPGAMQKVAIRNETTGNFINRKGVSRTMRETAGDANAQLKVSPIEEGDEFFWYIAPSESGLVGFNFASYHAGSFVPSEGGIFSFAGLRNVPKASGGNPDYKAVLWVHADGAEINDPVAESDYDTWQPSENFRGVIEGRAFNFFPQ